MAGIESKRSVALTQPGARKKHSATNPRRSAATSRSPHRSPKRAKSKKPKPKKRERLPASLRYTETKRGKTTTRRYQGRRFIRLEEIKGKTVDYVELFLCGEYHSIDVCFDDKTSLHFVVEPGFTLDMEHCDWKSGDWHLIKKWPLIHSESHRN